MRHINAKMISLSLPLLIAIVGFMTFGLYHLAKFETTDEHFWKYDRIQKYYHGIHDGFTHNNWARTRINDKPGVTVAILSGLGWKFAPDPMQHRNTAAENTTSITDAGKLIRLYDIFRTEETEHINFALRLPILLFNALIVLPLLFYILVRTFSPRIASVAILLIGLNPILIGISQIINPDAIFWGTAAIALLGFYAILTTKERKFVIICGLATGAALLSKYTANLLFIFYPIVFILHTLYSDTPISKKQYAQIIVAVVCLAWLSFSLLMPDVIQQPRHFLYGTIYSPVLSSLVDPVIALTHTHHVFFVEKDHYKVIPLFFLSLAVFGLVTVGIPLLVSQYAIKYKRGIIILLKTLPAFFLLIVLLSFVNAWTRASLFSLTDIKEVSQELDKLIFPQIAQYPEPLHTIFALAIQSQNVIFSLHPIVLLSAILIAVLLLTRKNLPYTYMLYFPFIGMVIFTYGGIISDIFVNIRYAIMLYVPFAVITAILFMHFFDQLTVHHDVLQKKSRMFEVILGIVILAHGISLYAIAPHFFNYENSLLPKRYTVVDSWGYGLYEAAAHLNTLPNAKDLTIWSDREGVCEFFIGKCINTTEINLDFTSVDYFVFTRRGILRRQFLIDSSVNPDISHDPYYRPETLDHPAWQLWIDDRPENFIKVIPFNKEDVTQQ